MRVEFGEFVFDSTTRELTRRGRVVPLAPKAFNLLQVLIAERPRAISKSELLDRLWPDVIVAEANLKNLVGEVRAACGAPDVIRTVRRHGYAFNSNASERIAARLLEGDHPYELREGENVLGRDEDCAVVLDLIGVSRRHARITVSGSRFVLDDLGSKNGTYLNDVRIRGPVELDDGDRVRLGGLPLRFRCKTRRATTATLGRR